MENSSLSINLTIAALFSLIYFIFSNPTKKSIFVTNIQVHNVPDKNIRIIESHNKSISKSPPVILFWKTPWNGYPLKFEAWNCPNMPQCDTQVMKGSLSTNKQQFINADAIIFSPVFDHNWPLSQDIRTEIEKYRRQPQVFAFLQREAPFNTHSERTESLAAYNNFFTDTITFRLDSTLPDIHTTLFDIQVKDSVIPENHFYDEEKLVADFANYVIPNKTKGALSVIFNCGNQNRLKLVAELLRLLKFPDGSRALEVGGGCRDKIYKLAGISDAETLNLARGKFTGVTSLSKDYYFYLSFENTHCNDYITEKFFHHGISSKTVPVVSGAPKSSYSKIVNETGFLYVEDFENTEQLANVMNEYLSGKRDYSKFFTWRKYVKNMISQKQGNNLCALCQKLYEIRETEENPERIGDINDWWFHKSGCHN